MVGRRSCRVLVTLALLLVPMAAFADNLSWTILPSGTYGYAGGPAPLTGTGIGIQSVQDTTTGTSFDILNGVLNFTTGASTGLWSWGPGTTGLLSLTGCINNVTVAGNCTSSDSAVLFDDEFTSAQIFAFGPTYKVQLGNISGTLNSTLAQKLGVSTEISSAFYNTTVGISAGYGSAFSNGANMGGTITAGATRLAEDWGIGESLGFFALLFVGFAAMIRLRVIQPLRWLASGRA